MPTAIEDPAPAVTEKSRLARRNYLAFLIEGGLFMAGSAFVQPQMLMPKIVESLQGPIWLIALIPVLSSIGYGIPALVVSHWIESLHRYRPLLLFTGVLQRLPYLFAGLILMIFGREWPMLTLVAVAVTPFINGLIGGSSFVAWQHLLLNTIPKNRWASLFAWRLSVSCILGVGAGFVVRQVLKQYPDTTGYGILHLFTFGFFCASYIAFACIREPMPAPRAPRTNPTLSENLRRMPGLFRGCPAYGWIVASRFFRAGMMIGMPFLSIYTLGKLNLQPDFIGYLIICQMIGSVAGNVIAGYWGDRSGSRHVALVATLLFIPLAIYIPFAVAPLGFYVIFTGFGFCFSGGEVGFQALLLEVCPDQDRTLYLSLGQFLTVPSMILASVIGSILWTRTGSMTDLMIATVISVAISACLLVRIERYRTLFHHVMRLAPLIRREG